MSSSQMKDVNRIERTSCMFANKKSRYMLMYYANKTESTWRLCAKKRRTYGLMSDVNKATSGWRRCERKKGRCKPMKGVSITEIVWLQRVRRNQEMKDIIKTFLEMSLQDGTTDCSWSWVLLRWLSRHRRWTLNARTVMLFSILIKKVKARTPSKPNFSTDCKHVRFKFLPLS